MESKRQIELVSELLDATERGDLSWRDAFDGGFAVSFPNNSVVIGVASGNIYLSIVNGRGVVIEQWIASPLDGNLNIKLNKLYETVRRRVFGVDAAIDDIISRLKRAS